MGARISCVAHPQRVVYLATMGSGVRYHQIGNISKVSFATKPQHKLSVHSTICTTIEMLESRFCIFFGRLDRKSGRMYMQ